MNSKESKEVKKSDLVINWKNYAIIATILLVVHIVGTSGGYDYLSEISPIYREIPISMVEPTVSKQCVDLRHEFTLLKDFLKIEGELTGADIENIAWADYQYYTKLQLELDRLNC